MAEITYLFVLAIVFVAFNEVIKNIKKYPPCSRNTERFLIKKYANAKQLKPFLFTYIIQQQ